ncbi:guanine nucleotide exchange factor DBS-like isoform X8 [Lates japonicus]|uniref:Guanine nucleotide exchange factor DBS-like isoform X8 n=1 Tax=Lates japonicus TaxID=270547 RepID=A0AAD3N0E9_LATJO|nr:guanine nucleotide exchange factor DBS-like isoform X8 [Lates japonicus]
MDVDAKCSELRGGLRGDQLHLREQKNFLLRRWALQLEKECQKLEHKLGFSDSYLLKPVQESHQRYQLLLKGNLSGWVVLLMQGLLSERGPEHKKGHARSRTWPRVQAMQRHLFPATKALLFYQEERERQGGSRETPSWLQTLPSVLTAEIKTWVKWDHKVHDQQLKATWSQQKDTRLCFPGSLKATTHLHISLSPFRSSGQKNQKKQDEKKAEPSPTPDANSSSSPKHKDETVTSPTTDRSSVAKKRFTLQGFSNLKSPKGSALSPEHGSKRHLVKSDPTPFGFKGWSKASLSVDASEENDGYSSGEDPMNSDPEDDVGKKLAPGKYTVVADCEKAGPQELSVKSGDVVQLIKEGEDGQWFVRNLRSSKEGWVAAANLLSLISESKSSQSLSSSDGSVSGNLSTSSSCSETYTSFSDIKP